MIVLFLTNFPCEMKIVMNLSYEDQKDYGH